VTVADGHKRAMELAFRALAGREHTEQELRYFLGRRGVDPEMIPGVIAEATALGLIDDARYAQRFAEDRRLLDRWGSERIAQDLARRGVQRELIEEALSGVSHAEELHAAVDLLNRRCQQPFNGDKDRDRAWRLLVRRGYEPEIAYTAVRLHERGFEERQAA
jgi:regulatory protein